MQVGKDWIALVIAVGISTALNMVTLAILWDALFSEHPGISANSVQLLTGWGGGMVGIIGAYIGYRAGASQATAEQPTDTDQK